MYIITDQKQNINTNFISYNTNIQEGRKVPLHNVAVRIRLL